MARLIDADALLEKLRKNRKPGYGYATATVGEMPTVDAVEVVRCKDCKHGIWDEENEMWKCFESAEFDEDAGEWFGFYEYHNGDFFCADGERKDNA